MDASLYVAGIDQFLKLDAARESLVRATGCLFGVNCYRWNRCRVIIVPFTGAGLV